jgi:hypothetical protein
MFVNSLVSYQKYKDNKLIKKNLKIKNKLNYFKMK